MDMDILNRPPSIAEDTVQDTLHPAPAVAADHTACAALVAQIHAAVDALLPDSFIWHRDAFELRVVQALPHEIVDKSSSSQYKLEGRMRIGDCIDDEWCVVWLLRELTKSLDVAVRYVPTCILFEHASESERLGIQCF